MSDEPLTTCPTCGGEIHRIVYPVGLVFKGSGFYSTDNRGSGGARDSSASTASTPSAEPATEKKPEPAPTKATVNE